MSFEERLHPRNKGKFAKGSGSGGDMKVTSRRRGGPETAEHMAPPAPGAKPWEKKPATAAAPAGPKDASHAELMDAKAAGHKVQLHRYDPAAKAWKPEGEPTSADTAMAKAQAAVAGKHVVRLEVHKPAGPAGKRDKTERVKTAAPWMR